MWILIIAVLLIIGCTWAYFFFSTSSYVRNMCKEWKNVDCVGACLDGFGSTCYFDSQKYTKAASLFENNEICFALHSWSVCEPCKNTFELKEDGQSNQVSCKEFFRAIEEKNESCNGCVEDRWFMAG